VLIPVRCFTCGFVIADKYSEYRERVKRGEDPAKVLDDLGVKRYCCRRMIVSNVDIIEEILPYYEAIYRQAWQQAER
jgi:DNA-directed RNA polymerase subunit N